MHFASGRMLTQHSSEKALFLSELESYFRMIGIKYTFFDLPFYWAVNLKNKNKRHCHKSTYKPHMYLYISTNFNPFILSNTNINNFLLFYSISKKPYNYEICSTCLYLEIFFFIRLFTIRFSSIVNQKEENQLLLRHDLLECSAIGQEFWSFHFSSEL